MAVYEKDLDLRENFLQKSDECELLVNKLSSMDKKIEQSSKFFFNSSSTNEMENCQSIRTYLGKQLNEKLNILNSKINKILVERVADDFVDINYPLKKMNEVIKSSNPGNDLFSFYNERTTQ